MFPLYAPTLLNVALKGRPSAPAILFVDVNESAAAAEQQAGSVIFVGAALETGVGSHQQSAQGTLNAARSESGSAVDARDAVDASPGWANAPPAKIFYDTLGDDTVSLWPYVNSNTNPTDHEFGFTPGLEPTPGSGITIVPATGIKFTDANGVVTPTHTIGVDILNKVPDDWATISAGADFANRLQTQQDLDSWISPDAPANHVFLDTSLKVPGALASFKILVLNTDGGGNSGMVRVNFGAVRTYHWGEKVWWSYRYRAPASLLYHPWIGGYNTGIKTGIFSNYNASFQLNECTHAVSYQGGSNNGYYINENGSFAGTDRSYAGFLHFTPGIDQGSVGALTGVDPDDGTAWTATEIAARRYGWLYQQVSNPRTRGGYGDPLVNVGRMWPDEWIRIVNCLDAGSNGVVNSRWRSWMVREAAPTSPLLLWDVTMGLGNGPLRSALWLGPYTTGRSDGGRHCASISGIAGVSVMNVSPGMEIGNATLEYDAATMRARLRTVNDGFGAWRGFSVANDIMVLNLRTASDVGDVTTTVNAVTLPQATIDLVNAAALPPAGTVLLGAADTANPGSSHGDGVQIVNYTGKSGNTLTGCTGGDGLHDAGSTVQYESYLQLKLDNPALLPQSGVTQATIVIADGRLDTQMNYNDVTVGRVPPGGLGFNFAFYETDFPLTENPISEGGKWVNGGVVGLQWKNVQTGSGNAYGGDFVGTPSRYNDPIAHISSAFMAFTPDQYATGLVYRVPGYSNPTDGHEIELLLRFVITANNARGYEVLWGDEGEIVVVRWNGPLSDYTPLATLQGNSAANKAVDGDRLIARIVGNTITVWRNGVQIGSPVVDTTYTDGQPGIGFWPTAGSTLASYGWKSFYCGDI